MTSEHEPDERGSEAGSFATLVIVFIGLVLFVWAVRYFAGLVTQP